MSEATAQPTKPQLPIGIYSYSIIINVIFIFKELPFYSLRYLRWKKLPSYLRNVTCRNVKHKKVFFKGDGAEQSDKKS